MLKPLSTFALYFLVSIGSSKASVDEICSLPRLLAQKDEVYAYLVENFFSVEECDEILNIRSQKLKQNSKTSPLICFHTLSSFLWFMHPIPFQGRFIKGTMCTNQTQSRKLLSNHKRHQGGRQVKYSSSYSIYPNEYDFTNNFEKRLLKTMKNLPIEELFYEEYGGKYQITHYENEQGYASHTDCTIGSSNKIDRAGTVLLYLENTIQGGETVFPNLDIRIKPKKGSALIFNSMDVKEGKCQETSRHEANAVPDLQTNSSSSFRSLLDNNTINSKTILQRWYYYETGEHMGQRVQPPAIPKRSEDTPYISCDGIGSYCRWYDEWGFTHLVDYRRQMGLTAGLPNENSFVWSS